MMNFRLVRRSALVDITGIADLRYIESHGEGLKIGALTPHRWVEAMEDPEGLEGFGVLKRAARWVGHYPIRTRGTFGGSIARPGPPAAWWMLSGFAGAHGGGVGPEVRRA